MHITANYTYIVRVNLHLRPAFSTDFPANYQG